MTSTTPPLPKDISSLRAAALLTLKSRSKPRQLQVQQPGLRPSTDHVDDNSSVASTKRAAPSPELDYGSDDGMEDAEGSTEEEEAHGGEKEEGEISEDEAPPAKNLGGPAPMDVDEEPLPGLMSFSMSRQAQEARRSSPPKQVSGKPPPIFSASSSNTPLASTISKPTKSTPPLPTNRYTPYNSVSILESKPRISERSSLPRQQTASPSPRPQTLQRPAIHVSTIADTLQQGQSNEVSGRIGFMRSQDGSSINGLGAPQMEVASPARVNDVSAPQSAIAKQIYARPSLNMSAGEFAEAKSIILDLLGWGVPPDYFLNCGLSRESVYYAFTELNLKLPSNLNTEGILPFIPPADFMKMTISSPPTATEIRGPSTHQSGPSQYVGASSQDDESNMVNGQNGVNNVSVSGSTSLSIPITQHHPTPRHTVPGVEANESDFTNPTFSRDKGGNNGVSTRRRSLSPSDPIPGLQSHVISQTDVTMTPPEASNQGYSRSLDEIETLRRQELLARKAVLASRKAKSRASPPVKAVTPDSDISTKTVPPLVPPESVDDFLKSITSTSTNASIDTATVTDALTVTRSPESMDMDVDTQPKNTISVTPRTATWSKPPAASSAPGAFDRPVPSRKSTVRRPVASDFVDNDSSSRGSPAPGFGSSQLINQLKPQLLSIPSFANVPRSQKVVIDFSDSEDEVMEDIVADTRREARIAQTPSSGSPGAGTPEPITITGPPPALANVTPDALALKEQEIKRMKALIAEREKNRQKQLANMAKNATPQSTRSDTPTASASPKPQSPTASLVSQPNTISGPSQSEHEKSTESPPPQIEAEEDAVIHDIMPTSMQDTAPTSMQDTASASIQDHEPTSMQDITPTSTEADGTPVLASADAIGL
ncbi:hypothetical protein M422DRAFT_25373 [Sphaerobolus stellatus SS14]|nr:hypothetical protein M422DRAFT_25373 [Sphaerobolus stellatus SS14]